MGLLGEIKNGFTLRHLDISYNNMSLVEPWDLAWALIKLETLNVSSTDLTDLQITLLLSAVREGMAGLDLSHNCNIATVDRRLLVQAMSRLGYLNVMGNYLTDLQRQAIETSDSSCNVVTRQLTDYLEL